MVYYFQVMHLSMLSPKGDPRAYLGHLTAIVFPAFENLTKNLGQWVFWEVCFFARRNGSHITPCARLCAGHLRIGVARLKPWQTAVFNRGKELFLYLYKNSASHYSFQGGYIWSDLTKFWGPTVRIWTKNSSEKPNVPHTCMQQLHYFLYGQNNWKKPGPRSLDDLWTTDLSSWGTPLWLAGPGYRTDWGVFPLSPLSLHLLHRCLPTKEDKNNTTE